MTCTLLMSMSGCEKDCISDNLTFVTPIQIAPAKSIYKVGDTIRVISEFEHDVRTWPSGGNKDKEFTLKLENFQFLPGFFLQDLMDTSNIAGKAFSYCSLFKVSGDLIIDKAGPYGEYSYNNGKYELEFHFIACRPGFYALRCYSDLNVFSNPAYPHHQQDFPGKCKSKFKTRVFHTYPEINGDTTDNNYHLLKTYPYNNKVVNNWLQYQPRYQIEGTYAFIVEE